MNRLRLGLRRIEAAPSLQLGLCVPKFCGIRAGCKSAVSTWVKAWSMPSISSVLMVRVSSEWRVLLLFMIVPISYPKAISPPRTCTLTCKMSFHNETNRHTAQHSIRNLICQSISYSAACCGGCPGTSSGCPSSIKTMYPTFAVHCRRGLAQTACVGCTPDNLFTNGSSPIK